MPGAAIFPSTRQGSLTDALRQMSIGAIFLDIESVKSASFWQKMYKAETHFSLRHARITHPVTCATCIAMIDRAPVKQ